MNDVAKHSIVDTTAEVRKKMKYRSENFAIGKLIIVEFLTMLFALGPAVFTWLSCIAFLRIIWNHAHFYLWLGALPLILIFSFLTITWLMRISLPKLKPGVYPIGTSKHFLAWLLTLYLGHAVRIAGLQPLFAAFYGLKYLYWRAMGANVAYGVNSSIFANFADYPLLTIKPGCTIGAFTFVCGHTFVGNKVLLGRVTLEENVYVGFDVTIGPNCKLEKGAWVGTGNRLIQDTVPANTRIENFEWEHTSAVAKAKQEKAQSNDE